MLNQKLLFQRNRKNILSPSAWTVEINTFEQAWIECRIAECVSPIRPRNYQELYDAFRIQLDVERTEYDNASSAYVESSMPLHEFKILVGEFALDGLTEAQVFYNIFPKLPLAAQMPLLRIMVDEFGSGNQKYAHTTLYINLLHELGMPDTYEDYLPIVSDSSLEFVNLFYWLCIRANDPSWFVGALTYLETIIPDAFDCFAKACGRLNISSHAYYTEHQHIDFYHAQDSLRILKEMDAAKALNYESAFKGMLLASLITNRAFDGAVNVARMKSQIRETVS